MASIDRSDAIDHLQMVERILSESSRRLCYGAEYFVVWGVYSGIATLNAQLISNGVLPVWDLWYQGALLAAAVAFTILRARANRGNWTRRSIAQREFFNVLWLAIGMAIVVNVAGFHLFAGWAQAAIWTVAESIVLLFIASHGNRRALAAGIVTIASLVAANFTDPAISGFVLAAGMFVGYAGFGFSELLARD